MFVLDPSIGSFVLVARGVRIPESRKTYSVNEANRREIPCRVSAVSGLGARRGLFEPVHRFHGCRRPPYVAKGRLFLYPPTRKNPEGKLRLMYEANPMAMIVEQAGGTAIAPVAADSVPARILDVTPPSIHQRTSVVLGSPREVEHVVRHLQDRV